MRILYYHQYFTTPSGAGGTRSYAMARCLVQRGHEVTLVCFSASGSNTGVTSEFKRGRREGMVDGIKVIELDLRYSNYKSLFLRSILFFRFAASSIGIAFREKYDLVFATSTPLTAGVPGIFAKFLRNKPFVFEVRDLWPELPRAMGVVRNPLVLKAMDILEWITYRSADTCIALSPGIAGGILRRGISSDRVVMVPNGCDMDIFNSGNNEPRLVEGLNDGFFSAIFTGAHGIANGLDAAVDAAMQLKKRGRKDIKLVFVGDGKLKPRLTERAAREKLDNCIFLQPVSKKDLAGILQTVNAGMMLLDNIPAFYYGTSPNKFFDYIASKLPVINNYPGWIADIIAKNRCGLVVPPGDAGAFADALEFMADNREELKKMGDKAIALAKREFDRRKLADIFVDCLEKTQMRKANEHKYSTS